MLAADTEDKLDTSAKEAQMLLSRARARAARRPFHANLPVDADGLRAFSKGRDDGSDSGGGGGGSGGEDGGKSVGADIQPLSGGQRDVIAGRKGPHSHGVHSRAGDVPDSAAVGKGRAGDSADGGGGGGGGGALETRKSGHEPLDAVGGEPGSGRRRAIIAGEEGRHGTHGQEKEASGGGDDRSGVGGARALDGEGGGGGGALGRSVAAGETGRRVVTELAVSYDEAHVQEQLGVERPESGGVGKSAPDGRQEEGGHGGGRKSRES